MAKEKASRLAMAGVKHSVTETDSVKGSAMETGSVRGTGLVKRKETHSAMAPVKQKAKRLVKVKR